MLFASSALRRDLLDGLISNTKTSVPLTTPLSIQHAARGTLHRLEQYVNTTTTPVDAQYHAQPIAGSASFRGGASSHVDRQLLQQRQKQRQRQRCRTVGPSSSTTPAFIHSNLHRSNHHRGPVVTPAECSMSSYTGDVSQPQHAKHFPCFNRHSNAPWQHYSQQQQHSQYHQHSRHKHQYHNHRHHHFCSHHYHLQNQQHQQQQHEQHHHHHHRHHQQEQQQQQANHTSPSTNTAVLLNNLPLSMTAEVTTHSIGEASPQPVLSSSSLSPSPPPSRKNTNRINNSSTNSINYILSSSSQQLPSSSSNSQSLDKLSSLFDYSSESDIDNHSESFEDDDDDDTDPLNAVDHDCDLDDMIPPFEQQSMDFTPDTSLEELQQLKELYAVLGLHPPTHEQGVSMPIAQDVVDEAFDFLSHVANMPLMLSSQIVITDNDDSNVANFAAMKSELLQWAYNMRTKCDNSMDHVNVMAWIKLLTSESMMDRNCFLSPTIARNENVGSEQQQQHKQKHIHENSDGRNENNARKDRLCIDSSMAYLANFTFFATEDHLYVSWRQYARRIAPLEKSSCILHAIGPLCILKDVDKMSDSDAMFDLPSMWSIGQDQSDDDVSAAVVQRLGAVQQDRQKAEFRNEDRELKPISSPITPARSSTAMSIASSDNIATSTTNVTAKFPESAPWFRKTASEFSQSKSRNPVDSQPQHQLQSQSESYTESRPQFQSGNQAQQQQQQTPTPSQSDPKMLYGMPFATDYAHYFARRVRDLDNTIEKMSNSSEPFRRPQLRFPRVFSSHLLPRRRSLLQLQKDEKIGVDRVSKYRYSYMRVKESFSGNETNGTHVKTCVLRLCPTVGLLLQNISYDVVKSFGPISPSADANHNVHASNVREHATLRFDRMPIGLLHELFQTDDGFAECRDLDLIPCRTFATAFVLRALRNIGLINRARLHGMGICLLGHEKHKKSDFYISGPFSLAQLVASGCTFRKGGKLEKWDGHSVYVNMFGRMYHPHEDVDKSVVKDAKAEVLCSWCFHRTRILKPLMLKAQHNEEKCGEISYDDRLTNHLDLVREAKDKLKNMGHGREKMP